MPHTTEPSVLLIDDEAAFVDTLAERLRLRGMQVALAYNGQEGLRLMLRTMPDVVVLDLRMPGMDGMETLKSIKAINAYTQVIIVTGHGHTVEQIMASRLAAHSFHKKPLDFETLLAAIYKAQRHKQEYANLALSLAKAPDDEAARALLKQQPQLF
jgi:DNA-binding NtrC family response regulator